jgi:hypothetical protein
VGSHRPLFLVGGKWSVRPSEFEKSAAKGGHVDGFAKDATLDGRLQDAAQGSSHLRDASLNSIFRSHVESDHHVI